MSWTPTDELREQAANAAASAENEHFEVCGDTHSVYEHIADAVLVAVGPHIAAQALRDAAAAANDDPEFRDPLRLKADWIRDRADHIEKEAGR